jgi:hypothetical protein
MYRLDAEIAAQRIDSLLNDDYVEEYDAYTAEEIQALVLSVMSHRRMIRTKNFNELLRNFETHTTTNSDATFVTKLYELYREILDSREFNFQASEVTIDFSASVTESLLAHSRDERIEHPRVQSEIARLSRNLEMRTRRECPNSSASRDDFCQDLHLYLLENAEKNFNPAKASYITYAITTLRFRSQILLSTVRSRSNREIFSTFENDEDSGTYHERLQADTGDSMTSSRYPMSVEDINPSSSAAKAVELSSAMRNFFKGFTPLEKSLLFLKNRMNCNVNTFPFDAEDIAQSATRRGVTLLDE